MFAVPPIDFIATRALSSSSSNRTDGYRPVKISVTVAEGGAGFVCDNSMRVKKVNAGSASEAAGVVVGATLVSFQGKTIPAGTTWGEFKDTCKNTAHPWAFNFALSGTTVAPEPVPAAAPASAAIAGAIVVKVSEGGAGFVCSPELIVKKITRGGASEAARVHVGMHLVAFKGGSTIWSKEQEPNMTWETMKELCKSASHPWAFTFVPAGAAPAPAATAPQPRPAEGAPPPSQRRRQRVQNVDGHEWVDGGPGGFSVKFDFVPNNATVPSDIEPHLKECTSDTEHLIKAEEMHRVLAATRARSIKPSGANDIVLWLANRMCDPSVNVKLKCLFVIKKLLADGSTTMQVVLRGKSTIATLRTGSEAVQSNMKAVLSFRAPPHEEHGDKPLQMLHKTCRVVQQLLTAEMTSELSRSRQAMDAAVKAEEARAKAEEEEAARKAADAAYKGTVEQKKAEMSAKVRAQKAEAARKLEEQRAQERARRGLAAMTWSDEPAPPSSDTPAPAPAPSAAEEPGRVSSGGGLFDDDGGLFGMDGDDDLEPTNLFAGNAVTVTADEVDDLLAGGEIDDDTDLQAAEDDLFAGDDAAFTSKSGSGGTAADLFGDVDDSSGAGESFSLFDDGAGGQQAPAPIQDGGDLFPSPQQSSVSPPNSAGADLFADDSDDELEQAPASSAATHARSGLFGDDDDDGGDDLFGNAPSAKRSGGLFGGDDDDDEDAAE